MNVSVRELTPDECSEVAEWEWPDAPCERTRLKAPTEAFAVIDEHDVLVGYCAFGGPNAMIPPLADNKDFANVAWGLRPDLTGQGQGHGASLIAEVAEFGRRLYSPRLIRAAIRKCNGRSLTAAKAAGFEACCDQGDYVILIYRPPTSTT